MDNNHTTTPCHICDGKCCRYFALEIDTPTTVNDFENFYWFLLHANTLIFVEEKKWFLQLNNPCKYLLDNKCSIYSKRPSICKEYGLDEDNKILCDKMTENEKHQLEFHNQDDLKKFILKRFPNSKKIKSLF